MGIGACHGRTSIAVTALMPRSSTCCSPGKLVVLGTACAEVLERECANIVRTNCLRSKLAIAEQRKLAEHIALKEAWRATRNQGPSSRTNGGVEDAAARSADAMACDARKDGQRLR